MLKLNVSVVDMGFFLDRYLCLGFLLEEECRLYIYVFRLYEFVVLLRVLLIFLFIGLFFIVFLVMFVFLFIVICGNDELKFFFNFLLVFS